MPSQILLQLSFGSPYSTYLHAKPAHPLSTKSERRLIALSEQLSFLFLEYGKYGGKVVAEWESIPNLGWQQELWNRIYQKNSYGSYLYRELKKGDPMQKAPHLSVHLFSISFLSKLHDDFFSHLSRSCPGSSLPSFSLSIVLERSSFGKRDGALSPPFGKKGGFC